MTTQRKHIMKLEFKTLLKNTLVGFVLFLCLFNKRRMENNSAWLTVGDILKLDVLFGTAAALPCQAGPRRT